MYIYDNNNNNNHDNNCCFDTYLYDSNKNDECYGIEYDYWRIKVRLWISTYR